MRLSRLDHTTTRSPVSLTLRPGLGQLVQAIRLVIVGIWCGHLNSGQVRWVCR